VEIRFRQANPAIRGMDAEFSLFLYVSRHSSSRHSVTGKSFSCQHLHPNKRPPCTENEPVLHRWDRFAPDARPVADAQATNRMWISGG
jgi:hypothetical protein